MESRQSVRYLIFDDMTQCTEAAVEEMLPLVSAQRRAQALKFRHLFGQFACLKSYLMLKELMGWSDTEAQKIEFAYNEYGQPRIVQEGMLSKGKRHFSISHCKQGIAVVVDESQIGVDIEGIRMADEALIERTMNEREQGVIADAEQKEMQFITFWTQKESFLKYRGTGIVDDLRHVLDEMPENVYQKVCQVREKKYVYTITYQTKKK